MAKAAATKSLQIGRGMGGSPLVDHAPGKSVTLGWSNAPSPTIGLQSQPVAQGVTAQTDGETYVFGIDVITTMLQFLLSTGWGDLIGLRIDPHNGTIIRWNNGALGRSPTAADELAYCNWSGAGDDYDVLPHGVGFGIPWQRIDFASFAAVRSQLDFDTFLEFNVFVDVESSTSKDSPLQVAKNFIEGELCRPLGLYLAQNNRAQVKLVRPKHPQKFHISKVNRSLSFTLSQDAQHDPPLGTSVPDLQYAALLPGIYNYTEMAAEVQRALNAATSDSSWTVAYDTGSQKFSVTFGNTGKKWAIPGVSSDGTPAPAWKTLGFTDATTTKVLGNAPVVAKVATAVFSGITLTENDMWGIQQIPTNDLQVTSVIYFYDYRHLDDSFQQTRFYVDAESLNLTAPMSPAPFEIKSHGLHSSEGTIPPTNSFTIELPPGASGCNGRVVRPNPGTGVDFDSATLLYASMLLDRYKQPPLKFKARVKWQFNTIEIGDVVQVNYQIPGVFVDRELDADVLTNRLFEVVEVDPNFRNGYLEVTFLGHRSVTGPSVVAQVLTP